MRPRGFQSGAANPSFRHGHATGGLSPEYRTWQAMMQRCHSTTYHSYADYGGRGIKVCARWQSFENFLADMGLRPPGTSLDRWPDNDGNYEPGNCRWATPTEQNRNQRRNVQIEAFGECRSLAEWCHLLGRNRRIVAQRIRRDRWDAERALQTATGGRH